MSISLYEAIPGVRFFVSGFGPRPELAGFTLPQHYQAICQLPAGKKYEVVVKADNPQGQHIVVAFVSSPTVEFGIPYELLASDEKGFIVESLNDPYKNIPPTGGSLK